MPKNINSKTFTITAGGGTELLSVNDPTELYRIVPDSGAVTLAANQTYSPTGSGTEGLRFEFEFNGGVTLAGNTLDFFGYQFSDAEALAMYIITATFIDGQYEVKLAYSANAGPATVDGANVQTGTITSTQLETGGIARTDIEDFTGQGFMLKGGVAGVVEEFDATGAGIIVVGQGADVLPRAMSGDATLAATGALTVANGAITPAKLSFSVESQLSVKVSIPTAEVITLNSIPVQMVPAPGAGRAIEVISASAIIPVFGLGYTTNFRLELTCDTGGYPQLINETILKSTVARGLKFIDSQAGGVPLVTDLSVIENAPLLLFVLTGNPAVGTSDLDMYVNYRIITL